MAGAHERDGRSWKAEWVALPEVCLLTGVALRTALTLADGLQVDTEAMSTNLTRFGDQPTSERLLAGLAARDGKHHAQQALQQLAASGHPGELGAAVVAAGLASEAEVHRWAGAPALEAATAMTDTLVRAASAARAAEPEQWC
jgi:adenylosuccinate lyase